LLPEMKITFRRNASYLDSLRLAFRHGIFLAPESFLKSMKVPFYALCTSIMLMIFTPLFWLGTKLLIVVAGLLGYVRIDATNDVSQD
jgi:hypothetical protein